MKIDAPFARRWFDTALAHLAAARGELNALNVFPVPDGDTGTNVVLTLTAGARAAQKLPETVTLPELTRAFADGALTGARGNSGIIVAQSLQALARSFAHSDDADAVVLVRAFDAIGLAASQAVARPVAGTIVTVARDVADAVLLLPPPLTLEIVMDAAVEAAHASLARTTELLEPLRGTAQVDAGALALVVLIDSLAQALGMDVVTDPEWFVSRAGAPHTHGAAEGFEVMYLVQASHRDATRLRVHLNEVGESVVVVEGSGGLWHVHVHLDHPVDALTDLPMSQVCVRHLSVEPRTVGVVAATTAPHLLEPLALTGAVTVLNAGAETLARAVVDAGAVDVVVFPCSEASAEAARQVAADPVVRQDAISATVAGTRDDLSVYESVLMLAASPDADMAALGWVCEPVAAHAIDGLDSVALETALDGLVGEVLVRHPAVVTVLVGQALHAHPAARYLAALVRSGSPATETYVIPGGQPSPALLVSVT